MTFRPARVVAIVTLAGLILAGSVEAATLVVSNNTDLTNGTVSNPAALIANPGPDGISLVEALRSVQGERGPHTISFNSSLADQTIVLRSGLSVFQDDVTIRGLLHADGTPAITIDADGLTSLPGISPIALEVRASNISISGLRFVRIRLVFAIRIQAGEPGEARSREVRNILVENTAFDNTAFAFPNGHSNAISVGMHQDAIDAVVDGVRILNSRFENFTGESDAVHIHADGTHSVISNVQVQGNYFSNVTFPVELVPASSTRSEIRAVSVIGNRFVGNQQPISIGAIGTPARAANDNLVDGTLIAGNTFENGLGATVMVAGGAVMNAARNRVTNTTIVGNVFRANPVNGLNLTGGLGTDGQPAVSSNVVDGTRIESNIFERNQSNISVTGGMTNADLNAVTNTTIVNNTIFGATRFSAIAMIAARPGGRSNRINGVSIVHNTIVSNVGGGIVAGDLEPGRGNSVAGVSIVNSIIYGNTSSFDGSTQDLQGIAVADVRTSIVGQTGFGGNGNVSADPRFANGATGDLHLLQGSPAIDAGTSVAGVRTDLAGHRRIDGPDIGAYEYGSAAADPPAVVVDASGPITQRSLAVDLTPPSAFASQTGSMFVWLALPSQGRVFARSATGRWTADLACEAPTDVFSGRLGAPIHVALTDAPSDLSDLKGAVVYAGYGIGATATAACRDMLDYTTFKAIYTIE